MDAAVQSQMTVGQFLAWEERQPLRYEFDGFQPVAMTGGNSAHDAVQMNLYAALVNRLRGKPCRPHGSDLKILVADRVRYPDAFVSCTPVSPRATAVSDPVVVFEVLNDSTANTDLIDKNAEYRATSSIRRYVVLEQTHAAVLVFVRKGEDWTTEIAAGDGAVLHLPEIGIEIPLAELYADVELVGSEAEPEPVA